MKNTRVVFDGQQLSKAAVKFISIQNFLTTANGVARSINVDHRDHGFIPTMFIPTTFKGDSAKCANQCNTFSNHFRLRHFFLVIKRSRLLHNNNGFEE